MATFPAEISETRGSSTFEQPSEAEFNTYSSSSFDGAPTMITNHKLNGNSHMS